MKTLNTAMWHEQEMKLCLKFNYHYSQKKKSHMLIFQWHLIYILPMVCSSYNRAPLGIAAKSINEVAIQVKRKMQYYRSNGHILKTNENPASHPTAKTFRCDTSTSHLHTEESQRNSKFPMTRSVEKS